jgi:hypothetical protein
MIIQHVSKARECLEMVHTESQVMPNYHPKFSRLGKLPDGAPDRPTAIYKDFSSLGFFARGV